MCTSSKVAISTNPFCRALVYDENLEKGIVKLAAIFFDMITYTNVPFLHPAWTADRAAQLPA